LRVRARLSLGRYTDVVIDDPKILQMRLAVAKRAVKRNEGEKLLRVDARSGNKNVLRTRWPDLPHSATLYRLILCPTAWLKAWCRSKNWTDKLRRRCRGSRLDATIANRSWPAPKPEPRSKIARRELAHVKEGGKTSGIGGTISERPVELCHESIYLLDYILLRALFTGATVPS
jgi:hypothetical protein